jgi:hypothetical protein
MMLFRQLPELVSLRLNSHAGQPRTPLLSPATHRQLVQSFSLLVCSRAIVLGFTMRFVCLCNFLFVSR